MFFSKEVMVMENPVATQCRSIPSQEEVRNEIRLMADELGVEDKDVGQLLNFYAGDRGKLFGNITVQRGEELLAHGVLGLIWLLTHFPLQDQRTVVLRNNVVQAFVAHPAASEDDLKLGVGDYRRALLALEGGCCPRVCRWLLRYGGGFGANEQQIANESATRLIQHVQYADDLLLIIGHSYVSQELQIQAMTMLSQRAGQFHIVSDQYLVNMMRKVIGRPALYADACRVLLELPVHLEEKREAIYQSIKSWEKTRYLGDDGEPISGVTSDTHYVSPEVANSAYQVLFSLGLTARGVQWLYQAGHGTRLLPILWARRNECESVLARLEILSWACRCHWDY